MENTHVRQRLVKVRRCVIHHLSYHRLEWFTAIGASCFFLGWYTHSEGFHKFAEFTMLPVLEAFLSRGEG